MKRSAAIKFLGRIAIGLVISSLLPCRIQASGSDTGGVEQPPPPDGGGVGRVGFPSGSSSLNDLLGLSNSGALVNEFTGQIAFSVGLGSISAQNGLAYGVNLSYYGATKSLETTSPQYMPGGWVGAGFNLKAPNIIVMGEDAQLKNQKYSLSLDGVSYQELIPYGTDTYVPKGNPAIRVIRSTSQGTSSITDLCPSQVGQITYFPVTVITGWVVRLSDGTEYHFGGGASGNCDASDAEMCQPIVSNNFKYEPFYSWQSNGKSSKVFYLSQIIDRNSKSSIFFQYDKVQDIVSGSCNSVDVGNVSSQHLDRAIYLREIFAVNGTQRTDFKTGQIIFNDAPKTEEAVFNPTVLNPDAFYETKKLSSIQFLQRGSLIKTLSFNYVTGAGRMLLDSIRIQAPQYAESKTFMKLTYTTNSTQMSSIRNGSGQISEFSLGTINTDKIANASESYQEIDLGAITAIPNTHIAFAQQIGNKFYVETENWSSGCNSNPTDADARRERLLEFENNGTHWALRQTWTAPTDVICPTAVNFTLASDGSYFIWAVGYDTKTELYVTKLSSGVTSPAITFTIDHAATNIYLHNIIYAYPNWFVVQNSDRPNEIFFYTKQPNGTWANVCPPDLIPSNYAVQFVSPRGDNYSGEEEFDSDYPNKCQYYNWPIHLYPSSNYIGAYLEDRDVLHLFGYDGDIKDYVRGLETSTPSLPNFSPSEVSDPIIRSQPRPWYRTIISNVHGTFHFDNNWTKTIRKVAASENFLLVESDADGPLKYLYVLGWDGKQLRYLYDEALHADKSVNDPFDAIDFAAGPDYFILKNNYTSDAASEGFFYYKVDKAHWSVTKNHIILSTTFDSDNQDWVLKPYSDYFFLEKMQQGKAGSAYSPVLTTDGSTSGTFYPSLNESYVFVLDANRAAVNVSSSFTRTDPQSNVYNTANFSGFGDRIIGADVTGSGTITTTGEYSIWKRSPSDPSAFSRKQLHVPGHDIVRYHSARLVSGGSMVAMYAKTTTEESLNELRFYPDQDLVPSSSDPAVLVPGTTVVKSITVKTAGPSSTGNNRQTIDLSYPKNSPEGFSAKILMNYESGVPNFKYVRKDFLEGASVTGYRRDEFGATLSQGDKSLTGTKIRSWMLPDKVSFKKPQGGWDSTQFQSAQLRSYDVDMYQAQALMDSGRTYFHSAYKPSVQYTTDYDLFNGQSKVSVSKVAGHFLLNLVIYQHDLDPNYAGTNFQMVRQTATFQFPEDPCDGFNDDHCSNIVFDPSPNSLINWFLPSVMPNIIASTITTYDPQERANAVYQWRADALGTVYPPLNGDPTATGTGWKWVKVSSITAHQDQDVALCKSDAVTESNQMGSFTSNYYGGPECDLLGTIQNSPLFSSALLSGEEDIKTESCANPDACLGAFGQWEAAGSSIQSQVVHTGNKAIQTTSQFGPSINLQIRKASGFMDRKKGFFASAWVLARPNSDPAFRIEFRKCATPPTPVLANDSVVYTIDVVQEYIAAKGPLPTGKWVKLERMIPYEELSSKGVFGVTPSQPTSSDYLRIWLGKSTAATANAVYIDDVRLYPADAGVTTQNYNALGQVSSSLDAQNEPTFFEYDVWGSPTGSRRKDGMVETANTVKLFNE